MGSKHFSKTILSLLCAFIVIMTFSLSASADMGPKPSVHIYFENLGDELCYGTLLSSVKSTGPASAWNGIESDQQHNENPNGQFSYKNFGYDIWKAFVDYTENDDFYFLQEVWQINETKELAWTYYPPGEFKILLYFPETEEFSVSGVYERYAFDSYYTVNMNGVKQSSAASQELSSESNMTADKSYDFSGETASLIARIIITIAIETAVALLFGFRKKHQLMLLIGVNAFTQIVLNVFLNIINYSAGELAFVFFYVLAEFFIFAIEAVIYCIAMKKLGTKQKANWFYIVYAFIANAVSFGSGLFVSHLIPGIF